MREKSLGLHGNYDDFRVESDYAKSFLTCMENKLKDINIFGENAKGILPFMENTLFDMKLSLLYVGCRRIFDQNRKNF
jgi:hypothetical protein